MTEQKSTSPTSSFSQSRIAAMKNEESTALAHPPTTAFPTPAAPQLNTDEIFAP